MEYLSIDEEQNALDYLEKAVTFIGSSRTKPIDWKWTILAIHAALYAFMICALKGTDPANVSTNSKRRTSKLINFQTAFDWCQEDGARACLAGFNKPLQVTEEEKRAVARIHHDFRNEFAHYQPKLWSIELGGMPQIVDHVLDVIHKVALEMGCYFVHYQPGDVERIGRLISEAKSILHSYHCRA